MLTFLLNAIKIIFLLGFLVLIHEGGHFLVAKFFKVKVNEFSIGFGKQICSKRKGETVYSIRMIPLGGFVSMLGEEERSDDERSFSRQSIPKRIAIVAAGGLVNIVFGILVYFLVLLCIGNFSSTTIDNVLENYNAQEVGIMPGDRIVSINDKHIFITKDVNNILEKNSSNELKIKIKRENEAKEISVMPTEVKSKSLGIYLDSEDGEHTKISYMFDDSPAKDILQVGDVILKVNDESVENDYNKLVEELNKSEGEVRLVIRRENSDIDVTVLPKEYSEYYLGVTFRMADKNFATRFYYAWFETGNFVISLADNVKSMFTKGVSVNQMMGPIGISKTVASTTNFYDFIYLMALISLSLGITNLLPFPALDGGKIILLLVEAIRRKPLKEEIEIWIQMIGFSLLILLSVYISYVDILRFF